MKTKNICTTDYTKLNDVAGFFVESDNNIKKVTKNALDTKIRKLAVETLDAYGSLLTEVEW